MPSIKLYNMESFINKIDKINDWVGRTVSWLTLFLVLLICADVIMRYLFDFTKVWVIELEIYFFAIIFLLGSGYAFQHDKHVRVDVFYAKLSKKKKAFIDLMGGLLFLLPWTCIIIWVGYNYSYFSLMMNESSAQPGGIPALYILKFMIVVGFFFLLLQAISSILKSVLILKA